MKTATKKRTGAREESANAKGAFDIPYFASLDFFDLAEEFRDK